MTLGSFTVGDRRIDVASVFSAIDGLVYRLTDSATGERVAVTTYRGLRVEEGAGVTAADLQDGLRGVLRRSRRG